jgi:hypothetical protein
MAENKTPPPRRYVREDGTVMIEIAPGRAVTEIAAIRLGLAAPPPREEEASS